MKKLSLILCVLFCTSSFGADWMYGRTIEKIGLHKNYAGQTLVYFKVSGETNFLAFESTTDYGKQRYALLLACQTNGKAIDLYYSQTLDVLLWGNNNNAMSVDGIREN